MNVRGPNRSGGSSPSAVNGTESAGGFSWRTFPVGLWKKAVLFGVAYFLCAEAGTFLSVPGSPYVTFWLPAGLYVAILLLNETRAWPWLILAALPANLAFDLHYGTKLVVIFCFYVANTVQALTGAWLVRRFVAEWPKLATQKELFGLLGFSAVFSTMLSATLGATTLVAAGLSYSFVEAWKGWWGTNAVGILLLSPFILTWFSGPDAYHQRFLNERKKLGEAALLMVASITTTWLLLFMGRGVMSPNKTLVLLPLLWAALRFGPRGATAATLLLALPMAFFTTQFYTGLTPDQITSGEYVFVMQLALSFGCLVGLVLAIVLRERDRETASLRESEERMRLFFERQLVGMAITSPERGWLKVNDRLCAMLDYPREELARLTWAELTYPEDLADDVAQFDRLLAGEINDYSLEKRFVRKDGELVHTNLAVACVRRADGSVDYVLALVEDITERKRAERRLAEAQSLLFAAVEQSPAGILIADAPDVNIRVANAAALGIRGETSALLTSIPAALHPQKWQVFHPDGQPFKPEELPLSQAVLFGKTSRNVKAIIRRTDGEDRVVLANAAPVQNERGEVVAGVVVFLDITDTERAERALVEQKRLLQTLVNHLPVAVYVKDPAGRKILTNPVDMDHLGVRSEAEVLGKTDFDFFPPEEAARTHASEQQALASGQPLLNQEDKLIKPDGSVHWLLNSKVPLYDAAGRVTGLAGIGLDITERNRLQSQLIQAQKMEAVGQLAGGVAHDFNNILTAVLMQLSLLQSEEGLSAEVRAGLSELETGANRATSLTRQLLMFSRRQVLQRQILDLNSLLGNFLKMLRRLIGEHIGLEFNGAPHDLWTEADPGMLEQVVMNLVVNARDAMPDGGRITLATRSVEFNESVRDRLAEASPGQFVCLSVTDNGCGMDASVLKHMFEPFFTTKEAGEGTGLGLATVYGIVKQHGGWVEVESVVGKGSTFSVYLPAKAQVFAITSDKGTVEAVKGGTETLLLVEDETSVRQTAVAMLRRRGYRVFDAGNAPEALRLWQQCGGKVDLLLTDMVMPGGMSGLELAEHLLVQHAHLQVILMSGYSSEMVRRDVPKLKGITFLQKPFVASTLAKLVRNCLDAK